MSGERSGKAGLSKAEQAAIRDAARERRQQEKNELSASEVVDKIASMSGADREIATGFNELVAAVAPNLVPRLWYGMPAYAEDGVVQCFVQVSEKFSTRYTTIGFSDAARLDTAELWPTAFAVPRWSDEVKALIADTLRKATGQREV